MNQGESPLKLISKKPPIISHKLLPKISFNLKDSLINFLEKQSLEFPGPVPEEGPFPNWQFFWKAG